MLRSIPGWLSVQRKHSLHFCSSCVTKIFLSSSWLSTRPRICLNNFFPKETWTVLYKRAHDCGSCLLDHLRHLSPTTRSRPFGIRPIRPGSPTRASWTAVRTAVDARFSQSLCRAPYGASCLGPRSPWVPLLCKHSLDCVKGCPERTARSLLAAGKLPSGGKVRILLFLSRRRRVGVEKGEHDGCTGSMDARHVIRSDSTRRHPARYTRKGTEEGQNG